MPPLEKKLHLGCGLITPAGWLNLDGSWNARFAQKPFFKWLVKFLRAVPKEVCDAPWKGNITFHDLRKSLPFRANSFQAIYSSHVLEHLYLEEAKKVLKECFRVLADEGILRVVVPDLKSIVHEYLGERPFGALKDPETPRADRLNKRLDLRRTSPVSGSFIYRFYDRMTEFHLHKWMYDAESLQHYFKWAGFAEVKEMPAHSSRIGKIEEIEVRGMLENGAGICVEGIKPGAQGRKIART